MVDKAAADEFEVEEVDANAWGRVDHLFDACGGCGLASGDLDGGCGGFHHFELVVGVHGEGNTGANPVILETHFQGYTAKGLRVARSLPLIISGQRQTL